MAKVNCSGDVSTQNLVGFQYKGNIFYRVIKPIKPRVELLVYYGNQYTTTPRLLGSKCQSTPLTKRKRPGPGRGRELPVGTAKPSSLLMMTSSIISPTVVVAPLSEVCFQCPDGAQYYPCLEQFLLTTLHHPCGYEEGEGLEDKGDDSLCL